jgi:hypothetical protein
MSERLGHDTSTHYFSRSGGPGVVSIKSIETHYIKLVFLDPMGSAVPVVPSGVSGVRNVDTLCLLSSGPNAISLKSVLGHMMLNLCFGIRWALRVT